MTNNENQANPSEEFQPQGKSRPLSVRAPRPRASMALNKRAVLVTVCVLAATLGFVVLRAFAPAELSKANITADLQPASPDEIIRNLPDNYSGIRHDEPKAKEHQIPVLTLPSPAEGLPSQSAEEKFREELRLLRLKQAAAARSSDVSFPGVQLPQKSAFETSALSGDEATQSAGSAGASPRDDDNRQDDKFNFLHSSRPDDPYLRTPLRSPLSPYQLMAGTVIPGVLLTGINSDLPGQILGQISQNVFNTVTGDYLLLPQGTKIIGEYDSRVAYGQERVLIVWTRLIFPNGRSISLEGMPGVDLSGYAGLYERVNNHYLKVLSGVVFGSLLGAGAQASQGSRGYNPSFSELAAAGMAQNLNEAGQQITRKNLHLQPTLEISPGQRFNVFVTKDMTLEPYEL